MILQHVYRPILNFFYDKITFRLNDRTRKIILFVCFLLSLQRSSHHNIFLSSMDLIVEYEIILFA